MLGVDHQRATTITEMQVFSTRNWNCNKVEDATLMTSDSSKELWN